ncbi:MAG: alpha/beta hydrolase family esterase [Myxococcota bacterium]
MRCKMTLILLSMLLFSAAVTSTAQAGSSRGCGTPGLLSGTYTLSHNGLSRTYRIQVPSGYDPNTPAPLIVAFHGWGGDENELLSSRVVAQESNARGFIVVAPRGLGSGAPDTSYNAWTFRGSSSGLDGDGLNASVPNDSAMICDPTVTPNYSYGSCRQTAQNTCSWTHCQDDDVDFTLDLIAFIQEQLCVDSERIFATGGSNGGMFTWELGQNPASASTFRAIAPLIGLPHRGFLNPPAKQGALPVLLITGTADTTVPPGSWNDASYTTTSNGSDRYYYTGAEAIMRVWAAAHGCKTDAAAQTFQDGYLKPDCRTYCPSATGWPMVLDCRARMGHTYALSWSWPLILDFFTAQGARGSSLNHDPERTAPQHLPKPP